MAVEMEKMALTPVGWNTPSTGSFGTLYMIPGRQRVWRIVNRSGYLVTIYTEYVDPNPGPPGPQPRVTQRYLLAKYNEILFIADVIGVSEPQGLGFGTLEEIELDRFLIAPVIHRRLGEYLVPYRE